MKDRMFNLAVLGVVGIVLLLSVILLVSEMRSGQAVIKLPVGQNLAPAESVPAEGEKCLDGGSCRTLQLCSTVSDGLYIDGVGMGCVNAKENAAIPYCGRLTLAQNSEPCNYQDKNPRCVCP